MSPKDPRRDERSGVVRERADDEDTGVHDDVEVTQKKIASRLGAGNRQLEEIRKEQRHTAYRYEALSNDLVEIMVKVAEQNVMIEQQSMQIVELRRAEERATAEARQAREAAEIDARTRAARAEEYASRRTLALIAIIGPILSALIAATAVLIAKS